MTVRPWEVRRGMVLVGEAAIHLLVLGWTGPVPSSACFAPYRFRGRCPRTGRPGEVVVPQGGVAEVLELPESTLEFVCRQDGDLLLHDSSSGEVACVPDDQAGVDVGELDPGTAARVLVHERKPVWVVGR